jgi:Zn-dependent peptidase ImmA (M78 family)
MVGVTRSAISSYENDHASPGPNVLPRLATVLNMPTAYFTRPMHELDRGAIFYRSMAAATKSARERAEGRFSWLREIVDYISTFVELPEPNFPDLGLPDNPLQLSDDDVEMAAERLRRHWGLHDGPIGNVVRLMENQGAVLTRDLLGSAKLDGLSEFVDSDGRPYVLIGTDKGSSVRWRFDAAHELGHAILHTRLDERMLSKPAEWKDIESQAHRFAAAFLLPLAPFCEDFVAPTLDALRAMKPKWKVSIGMMIMRARHAELISEQTERFLWINYGRRKWRRSEPYDDVIEPEEPRLLRRAFELIVDEGMQTPDDVLAALPFPASDIEALSGLPAGYLSDDSAPVRLLGASSDERPTGTATGAAVIEMRSRDSRK